MFPILIAVGAGLLALAASSKDGAVPDKLDGKGSDAGKVGNKRPARRMSPSEAFEAGKKARDAEFKLKADEEAAFNLKVEQAIKARDKAAPAAPAKPPEVKTEPKADGATP